jgi:drug/metabolite transporter (DMT)-like permease
MAGMQAPRARDLAAFWLLSILWSGNWLFIKVGLEGLPPFRFAGLRLALAFVLLTIVLATRPKPSVTAREARAIALIGFLQIGVSYACVFTAEQWIDSGLTALLFSTFAIWVAVLGHFLLPGEPLTARTAVATLAGVGGVAVIQAPALARIGSLQGRSLALGGLLVLASAAVSALSAVIIKKRLTDVSAIASVWGQSIVAVVVLLGASAIFESANPSRWTPGVTFALGYLAVIGTFTFLGSQWLIPLLPVGVVGTFPILNTLLALLWGSILAGGRLTARAFVGGALILFGVGLVTVRTRTASAAPQAREAAG